MSIVPTELAVDGRIFTSRQRRRRLFTPRNLTAQLDGPMDGCENG